MRRAPRPLQAACGLLMSAAALLALPAAAAGQAPQSDASPPGAPQFAPLFPEDSLDEWYVRDWSDVAAAQQTEGAAWDIRDGVLSGLGRRTWLFSDVVYGDFVLRFDFKISQRANGGVGLRFPPQGDPAYRGLEVQIVDHQGYYPSGSRQQQRTGAIYDAIPPAQETMHPVGEWNQMVISCRGARVVVVLNDVEVVNVDLAEQSSSPREGVPPLAERPREGLIGFQNLAGSIALRHIEIKRFDEAAAP